ncbi:hypothetical protein EJB05_29059, partial [Eragrostis curvula]
IRIDDVSVAYQYPLACRTRIRRLLDVSVLRSRNSVGTQQHRSIAAGRRRRICDEPDTGEEEEARLLPAGAKREPLVLLVVEELAVVATADGVQEKLAVRLKQR